MKHWIERIADELNEMDVEKHVIASGTSISGSIHIGNSCDVFIANAIGKALRTLLEKCLSHFLNLMTNTLVCLTL